MLCCTVASRRDPVRKSPRFKTPSAGQSCPPPPPLTHLHHSADCVHMDCFHKVSASCDSSLNEDVKGLAPKNGVNTQRSYLMFTNRRLRMRSSSRNVFLFCCCFNIGCLFFYFGLKLHCRHKSCYKRLLVFLWFLFLYSSRIFLPQL